MNHQFINHLLGIQPGIYSWTITRDLYEESCGKGRKGAVGVVGPSHSPLDHEEIIRHPERQRFRLVDDDNEPMAEGYMVDLSTPEHETRGREQVSGFEPLDDYGMACWGCTAIQYWKPGKGGGWETL